MSTVNFSYIMKGTEYFV